MFKANNIMLISYKIHELYHSVQLWLFLSLICGCSKNALLTFCACALVQIDRGLHLLFQFQVFIVEWLQFRSHYLYLQEFMAVFLLIKLFTTLFLIHKNIHSVIGCVVCPWVGSVDFKTVSDHLGRIITLITGRYMALS